MNSSVEPGSDESRDRVGTPDASEGLEEHLLPTLLHDLGNQTQFLMGLRAVLGMQPGGDILRAKAADLARVSGEIEDAGWALALIASAAGANLMLARREPRGLEIAFALVDNALRRNGSARPVERALPWPTLRANTFAGDEGWQLPWGVANLWWSAGLDASERAGGAASGLDFAWELHTVGEEVRLRVPAGRRTSELASSLPGLLPGARLQETEGDALLAMPASWMEFAGTTR